MRVWRGSSFAIPLDQETLDRKTLKSDWLCGQLSNPLVMRGSQVRVCKRHTALLRTWRCNAHDREVSRAPAKVGDQDRSWLHKPGGITVRSAEWLADIAKLYAEAFEDQVLSLPGERRIWSCSRILHRPSK